MKKFIGKIVLIIALAISQWLAVNAQVITSQKGLTTAVFQAVARDVSGNLISNQTISLRFSIHDSIPAGTVIYRETQSATTNQFGLFTVSIGEVTPLIGTMENVNWGLHDKYMQIEMDAAGGTTYTDMGTQQMLTVPTAMYASKAGSAKGTDVIFIPTTTLTATNVQGAIEEVDAKWGVIASQGSVVYSGTWNAVTNTPALTSGMGTKGYYYVVSNASTSSASPNTTLDGISDWQINDWVIYNGSIWQKVDNSQAPVTASDVIFVPNGDITATNVQDAIDEVRNDDDSKLAAKTDKVVGSTANNIAILSATGNLVDGGKQLTDYLDKNNTLSYTPSTAYNPATKKYVDDADGFKLNLAGGTMSGDLILNADPSSALGAATKQYVDDAGIALGNSYIHKLDDGVSIYTPPSGTRKRFGIGDTAPDAPLGIKGDATNDDQMISMKSADGSTKWNINLNPSPSDVPGFSIDDISTGTGVSRLFIQPSSGYVGMGTFTPSEKLHIVGTADGGTVSMQMENTASGHDGWKLSVIDDNAVPERVGAFGIAEKNGTSNVERITVLPTITNTTNTYHNVGINEPLPYAPLHVNRDLSDPKIRVDLDENTGILVLGSIADRNLGFDHYNIQARTGSIIPGTSTLSFTASTLGIQPRGGDIIIHSDYTADHQVKVTDSGKIGVGKDPIESVDVNGAISIGDASSATPANGTIRWTGTDFEGRKGGAWVSMTSASSTASQSVAFLARQTSNIPAIPGNYTNIPYGTEVFDDANGAAANNFNSSTGVFTAPVSGIYHFDASVAWLFSLQTNPVMYLELIVNGSNSAGASVINALRSGQNENFHTAIDLNLTAGDQVRVRVAHNNASSSETVWGLAQYCYFSGNLIH